VQDKSNEITAIPALLSSILGCVVTPMPWAPKTIAQQIHAAKADYILSLKANPQAVSRRRHLVSDRSCCGYFTHPTEHTLKPDIIAPKSHHLDTLLNHFPPCISRRMGGTSDNCCR